MKTNIKTNPHTETKTNTHTEIKIKKKKKKKTNTHTDKGKCLRTTKAIPRQIRYPDRAAEKRV